MSSYFLVQWTDAWVNIHINYLPTYLYMFVKYSKQNENQHRRFFDKRKYTPLATVKQK